MCYFCTVPRVLENATECNTESTILVALVHGEVLRRSGSDGEHKDRDIYNWDIKNLDTYNWDVYNWDGQSGLEVGSDWE